MKRQVHDMKRIAKSKPAHVRVAVETSTQGFQTPYNATTVPPAAHAPQVGQTFFTACPICKMQCQYLRTYENYQLQCPKCKEVFVARDIHSATPSNGAGSFAWPFDPHRQDLSFNKQPGSAAFNGAGNGFTNGRVTGSGTFNSFHNPASSAAYFSGVSAAQSKVAAAAAAASSAVPPHNLAADVVQQTFHKVERERVEDLEFSAEAAFQLIGEAWAVLSDKMKRQVHDMKRIAKSKPAHDRVVVEPSTQGFQTPYNATTVPPAAHAPQVGQTFFTACPICKMQCQYLRTSENYQLQCPKCKEVFVARDIHSATPSNGAGSFAWPFDPHRQDLSFNKQPGSAAFNRAGNGFTNGGVTGSETFNSFHNPASSAAYFSGVSSAAAAAAAQGKVAAAAAAAASAVPPNNFAADVVQQTFHKVERERVEDLEFSAEAAFQLIGEAWGVLSDKMKRQVHDMKRIAKSKPAHDPVVVEPSTQGFQTPYNATTVPPAAHAPQVGQTFFTACPICKMQCQYLRTSENYQLLCPKCKEVFVARDIHSATPSNGAGSFAWPFDPHRQDLSFNKQPGSAAFNRAGNGFTNGGVTGSETFNSFHNPASSAAYFSGVSSAAAAAAAQGKVAAAAAAASSAVPPNNFAADVVQQTFHKVERERVEDLEFSAEAAFQLIGEAWGVLSDKMKRQVHDMKRIAKSKPAHDPVVVEPSTQGFQTPYNATTVPPAAHAPQVGQTFFTACPICKMQCQYLRTSENYQLLCPKCKEVFVARDIHSATPSNGAGSFAWPFDPHRQDLSFNKQPGTAPFNGAGNGFTNGRVTGSGTFNSFHNPASSAAYFSGVSSAAAAAAAQSTVAAAAAAASSAVPPNNLAADVVQQTFHKVERERVEAEENNRNEKDLRRGTKKQRNLRDAERSREAMERLRAKKKEQEMAKEAGKRKMDVRAGTKLKRKKGDSEQEDGEDLEDDDPNGEDPKFLIAQVYPKKAKGGKSSQGAESPSTVKAIHFEGDFRDENPLSKSPRTLRNRIRSPKVPFGSQAVHIEEHEMPQQPVPSPTESPASTPSSRSDSEDEDSEDEDVQKIVVPDPDFHDFDKYRNEADVFPGQVWAMFDDQDGMPRFYGRISKVSMKPFKAHMNWLERSASSDQESAWTESTNLSIACGEFKITKAVVMDQINTFSHIVMDKSGRTGSLRIYPKKGQVWAVYRHWDAEQRIGPAAVDTSGRGSPYTYDMVEILSDFDENRSQKATLLLKVSGYKTVFSRQKGLEAVRFFKPAELVKFSHSVPNQRIDDEQADPCGIPRGALELDPASTPLDLIMGPSDTLR